MRTVKLGEVATVVSGATPRTATAAYWNGEIPWATPADLSKLDSPYISSTPRMLTEAGVQSCATSVLPEQSVLLSSRAPIGHVAINTVPMATNQGFKSLVPRPELDAKYLYHWLTARTRHLQSLGNGATFKELSKKTVEGIDIPFPELCEQRRIAAILDAADTIRTKRREQLARLDELPQAIFHAMFDDTTKNRIGVPFGEVAALVGGRNLVHTDSSADTPYRVLKISAVTTGQFLADESKPLPPDYIPPSSHLVRRGDLLMSRANTADLVGAVARVIDPPPANLALPDKIWRLNLLDPATNPIYLQAVLGTPAVRRQIGRLASGTGGSMKNVSKAKLEGMCVPMAAPDLQREFAAKVEAINARRADVKRALALDDELFASLQSRAFSGGL